MVARVVAVLAPRECGVVTAGRQRECGRACVCTAGAIALGTCSCPAPGSGRCRRAAAPCRRPELRATARAPRHRRADPRECGGLSMLPARVWARLRLCRGRDCPAHVCSRPAPGSGRGRRAAAPRCRPEPRVTAGMRRHRLRQPPGTHESPGITTATHGRHDLPAIGTTPRPPADGQNLVRERHSPRQRRRHAEVSTCATRTLDAAPHPRRAAPPRRTSEALEALEPLTHPARDPREPSEPAPRRPTRGRTRPPRAPAAPATSR
jgi:hypothetical protein